MSSEISLQNKSTGDQTSQLREASLVKKVTQSYGKRLFFAKKKNGDKEKKKKWTKSTMKTH